MSFVVFSAGFHSVWWQPLNGSCEEDMQGWFLLRHWHL